MNTCPSGSQKNVNYGGDALPWLDGLIRVVKIQIELQQRVFVVWRRARVRWKALMLYFLLIRVPKYVHTTGTLYAHIRHTAGTAIS